jgi:hypothetical protein
MCISFDNYPEDTPLVQVCPIATWTPSCKYCPNTYELGQEHMTIKEFKKLKLNRIIGRDNDHITG